MSQIVKEKEAKIGELEQLVKARPDHPLALRVNFTDAYSSPGNLYKALRRRDGRLAVVGEMKRLHPRDAGEEPEEVVDYDERSIRAVSSAVAEWGCDAGMVWTDSRYGGNLNHLVSARKAVKTPLVCADFIIHPLQLAEASLSGADAVLLVAGACLPDLEELLNMATLMGLECIVEVHTEVELALAIDAGASILYCSNLDRRTNTLDMETAEKLRFDLPDFVITVAGGGISSAGECWDLMEAGFDAVILGRTLFNTRHGQSFINEVRSRKMDMSLRYFRGVGFDPQAELKPFDPGAKTAEDD